MLNMRVKENLRSGLVITSLLVGLLSGTGLTAAQVVDDPPGSVFQDQGIREEQGYPPLGEPLWRVPRIYVSPAGRAAYGTTGNRPGASPQGRASQTHTSIEVIGSGRR